ncbi:MAG TPA: hypothetical protein DC000_03465 [Clostridiales bacterium]|nr:hypothetical protein [Clostridiales bacterium]
MLKKLPKIKTDNIKAYTDVQQLLMDKALPFELFTKVCKDFVSYEGYNKKEKAEILEILNDQSTTYDVVYKINVSNKRWVNLYFSMRNKDDNVYAIVTSYETYQDFMKSNNFSSIPCNTITMLFKERGAITV